MSVPYRFTSFQRALPTTFGMEGSGAVVAVASAVLSSPSCAVSLAAQAKARSATARRDVRRLRFEPRLDKGPSSAASRRGCIRNPTPRLYSPRSWPRNWVSRRNASRAAAATRGRSPTASAERRSPSRPSRPSARCCGLLGVDGVDAAGSAHPQPRRRVARGRPTSSRAERPSGSGAPSPRGRRAWTKRRAASPDPEEARALGPIPAGARRCAPLVEAPSPGSRATGAERERRLASHPPDELPLLYAIVATGNIHEDIVQAEAAARAGAQCIAVIRSTAQSLLDHVPYGATTTGFGGTFATQENFRLMRAALDRLEPRDRPLRPAGQLLLGALHARDRGDGRPRAPRHDVERLALRDHLSRHQPAAHAHRPELLAPDQRRRRRRDQHGRGQLPDDRGRGRAGARGPRLAVHQRVPGARRRARALADRPRARLRDRPGARGRPPLRDRAGAGGAGDLSRRAPEVHAADQAHDGQRLSRLSAERALHADVGGDRAVHSPARDAHRGPAHAAAVGPLARDRPGPDDPGQRPAPRGRDRSSRPDGRIVRRAHEVLEGAEELLRRDRRRGPFRRARVGCLRRHAAPPRRRARARRRPRRATRSTPTPSARRGTGSPPRRRRERDRERDRTRIRPYGDKWNDGVVQVSFTLPLAALGPRGRGRQALRRARWGSATPM